MDQVFTFDKSLQQRLQEYKDVLSGYEVLPISAISREWSFYLELVIDPNGWQAIWKIPRATCESLDIPFPTVVLVFVLNVQFKELNAFVKILAVQDDNIHISENHYVPLIQLWPTIDQDETIALNINSTANAVDMLRFFYMNIFMPWDYEDDDTSDWLTKHLESRLRLHYDVKKGIIPRSIAQHLNSLLSEARRIHLKKEHIECELMCSDVDIDDNPENPDVIALMELHLQLTKIKNEVEILENPLLRNAVIRHQKKEDEKGTNIKQQVWLIHEESKVDSFITFLETVKKYLPEAVVKFSVDLASTLETSNANDMYILNNSIHSIQTVGALENGGVLKGISDKSDTILTSNIESVMLDFNCDNVLLENLTIDAKSAQCAIVVRRGRVLISNCKIIGDGKSSTHQGIIVLAGGEVELIDSEITQFYTAIVGNSGSKITLKNTEVHGVSFGLKIFDNCTFTARKSKFRNCKCYGICVETDNNQGQDINKAGDFELLKVIPNVSTESITGENNAKGDVLINHKNKIKPLIDVFSNRSLHSELCGYGNGMSDEEMNLDNSNDETMIENPCPTSTVTI